MQRRIFALIWKEFKHIFRDPRTLALVLVIPVVQLILYGYATTLEIKEIPTGIYDLDKSSKSRELVRTLSSGGYFRTFYLREKKELSEALETGKAKMAVVIPPDFFQKLGHSKVSSLQIVIDGSEPTSGRAALNYSSGAVKLFERQIIEEGLGPRSKQVGLKSLPINSKIKIWYNPELKSSYFMVPGLIALLLIMIPAVLTSVAIVREKEWSTLEHIIVSPVRIRELILGKIFPYLIIAAVDALVISVVGILWFKVPLEGNIFLLAALTLLYMLSTVSLGLLFSTMADSMQVAMLMVWMATMLPSFMLSGFVFPIPSMPRVIQYFSYAVPARYFLVIVRGIFLKGSGLFLLWKEALALAVFSFFLMIISGWRFKKRVG